MILVFGGAYNGKLCYVKQKYDIIDNDIYFCEDKNYIDFSKTVIYNFQNFIYYFSKQQINPLEFIDKNIERLNDKIIICNDISCGIVPMDKTNRIWREDVGKCLQYLTKKSDKVYRIFFGIEMILKNE